MSNAQKPTLVDRFNEACKRVQGTMNIDVLESEFGNLCDKFELLWDQAESAAEKYGLTKAFAELMAAAAAHIKSQPNAIAIESTTSNLVKLTVTAQKLDPERSQFTGGDSYLFQSFQDEAAALSKAAKRPGQPASPRLALLHAADVLTLAAYAFRPVVPPAPKPEPVVLPKEPVPPFHPVLDPEVRRAMKALGP